jgi:thiol-disulfide isomerase/thioredoxin
VALRAGRALALAGLLAACLALTGCSLEQDVASKPLDAGPTGGQPAPQLRGALVDGGSFDLSSARGRPVVIDFFATWCGPCHHEQPGLNSIAARYTGRVTVVGVDMKESAAEVTGYEHAESVPYGALIDSDGSLSATFNVPAPPVTLVVDSNGRIAKTFIGEVSADVLASSLDALLTGQPGTSPVAATSSS